MARQLIVELVGRGEKLSKTLEEAERKTGSFGSGLGKLAGSIGGLVAGAGLVSFLGDSVTAFNESAQAQAKLTTALSNSPATVGVTAAAFADFNKELAKHTLADDDALAAGQAVLANFGLTEQQLKGLTPVVADVAATMGTDIPSAADTVGKALLGNTKALKSLGIEGFKPTGDRAADLATLQQLLADKTKGAAQAQLDAAGPSAKMNKSLDELKETVGSKLVPALNTAVGWVTNLMDGFTNLSPGAQTAIEVVGGLAIGLWAFTSATAAATAVTTALGIAEGVALGPIILVVAAIAALAAGLIYAYTHFEGFRKAVDVGVDVIQAGFNGMAAIATAVLRGLIVGALEWAEVWLAAASKAFGWVPGLGDKLETAHQAVATMKDNVNQRLGEIQNKFTVTAEAHTEQAMNALSGLSDKIQMVQGFAAQGVHVVAEVDGRVIGHGGFTEGTRAAGGPVTAGMPYVVGEKRPELFIPGSNGHILPYVPEWAGSTTNISIAPGAIVVNGGNRADVDAAFDRLLREMRSL